MAKITGRVEVLVDGELLLNKPGAIARGVGISGEAAFEREAVMGDTGLHGFTENPIVAECEVTITDRDDILLDRLAKVNGTGTVVFRAAGGGKVYTMHEATCLNGMEITAGQGEVKVKFQGPYWTETTSTS